MCRARGRAARPAPSAAPRPAPRQGEIARALSYSLASQVALGLAGLASLPILARNLGPERYGALSIFLTLLGLVVYQDFARPLLVVEGAASPGADARRLDRLARSSLAFLLALAAGAGLLVLELALVLPLCLSALLHGLASRDFARLSLAGRVGPAHAVRNSAFAAAALGAAALSFRTDAATACVWPFAGANLAIALAYRAMARAQREDVAEEPIEGAATARRQRRAARDLIGFTLAASLVVSVDRLLLERCATAGELGRYLAQCDLALKVNMFGTALAAALLPALARAAAEEGPEHADERVVALAARVLPVAFALLALGILIEKPLVDVVLGPAFREGPRVVGVVLAAAFVQLAGYLLSPLVRARGDFATQRRAYVLGALAALVTGVLFVPRYGALGAVAALAAARSAEVALVLHEVRRLPRTLLPAKHVAAWFALLAVLAGLAATQLARSVS